MCCDCIVLYLSYIIGKCLQLFICVVDWKRLLYPSQSTHNIILYRQVYSSSSLVHYLQTTYVGTAAFVVVTYNTVLYVINTVPRYYIPFHFMKTHPTSELYIRESRPSYTENISAATYYNFVLYVPVDRSICRNFQSIHYTVQASQITPSSGTVTS